MDYLDRGKAFRHHILLMIGYMLIAVAITVSALVLLYQAYGFGIDKGKVIQNGLLFFSSQPSSADIYVNGKKQSSQTNTRLVLPADIYKVTLAREGYHDWQRSINLLGGSVQHYDYPLLIPRQLKTEKLPNYPTYTGMPGVMTQSPDKRWLIIQKPGSLTDFDLYDLRNPEDEPLTLALPDTILAKTSAEQALVFEEWSADNRHVVLSHTFEGKTEYILLDREDMAQSRNLNTTLSANPTKLTLIDRKYDQYYLYDASSKLLQTASLKTPTPETKLQSVLAYKSYGDDTLLYVTDQGSTDGRANLKLLSGSTEIAIRSLAMDTVYLIDLAKYDDVMYVVAGAQTDGRVYMYRDPIAQRRALPKQLPVPLHVLKLDRPNYLSFSSNVQYVMAQSGSQFSVYDILTKDQYSYTSPALDAPQTHATWMDGNRIASIIGGKMSVVDYDNRNRHALMTTSSSHLPAYAPNYRFIYTLGQNASGQYELQQTSLLAARDQ